MIMITNSTREMADKLQSLEEALEACSKDEKTNVSLTRWEAGELLWLLREWRKDLWRMDKEN